MTRGPLKVLALGQFWPHVRVPLKDDENDLPILLSFGNLTLFGKPHVGRIVKEIKRRPV